MQVVVHDDVAPLVELEVRARGGEQRVGPRADGDDHDVAGHDELRAGNDDGPGAARGVGLAQLHADALEAGDPFLLVAEHFDRRDEELELDAFLSAWWTSSARAGISLRVRR
jgi:hypothetical protein